MSDVPDGFEDFMADLARSINKYPQNNRMFDGLMGEVDELRRAYSGDGDVTAEAFDVAVCAFRIATEGDAGGNTTLAPDLSVMAFEQKFPPPSGIKWSDDKQRYVIEDNDPWLQDHINCGVQNELRKAWVSKTI